MSIGSLFSYAALGAAVGGVVGAVEILQRYRDAPFRAVFNGWGACHLLLNAAVSYGAFWILTTGSTLRCPMPRGRPISRTSWGWPPAPASAVAAAPAYPAHRPGQLDGVAAHPIGDRHKTVCLFGFDHDLLKLGEGARQPRCQAVGQQAEGGVRFPAVPARYLRARRCLASVGAVPRERAFATRVIRTPSDTGRALPRATLRR